MKLQMIPLMSLLFCISALSGKVSEPGGIPPLKHQDTISHNKRADITHPISISTDAYIYRQYPVKEPLSNTADSGYYALMYGLRSCTAGESPSDFHRAAEKTDLSEKLFSDEKGSWRERIISERKKNLVRDYLSDQLLLQLPYANKVNYLNPTEDFSNNQDVNTLDILIMKLKTEPVYLMIDKNLPHEERRTVYTIAFLCGIVAEQLAEKASSQSTVSLTRKTICTTLLQESKTRAETDNLKLITNEDLDKYLGSFTSLTCSVKHQKNSDSLLVGSQEVYKRSYGPVEKKTLGGSYLTDLELETLAKFELDTRNDLPIKTLLYSSSNSVEEYYKNGSVLKWLRINLSNQKEPRFQTILLIADENKNWFSCVITKNDSDITLLVIDHQNKERMNDEGIREIKDAITQAMTVKIPVRRSNGAFNDLINTSQPQHESKNDAEINYDAPYAHVPLSELPSLEDLFGGKLPNNIAVRMKYLEGQMPPTKAGSKIKNSLIFYGPPGTGKSTIAQVMARKAGWSVVYAGGGDFRTAYQGSGKAKLDKLFAEAKKRGKCVIIIDEIDGTAAQLETRTATQEDNRAVKALITTLDQHQQDPDLYIICTTNNPEKLDPAIRRRFNCIEIPLPDYRQRQRTINYYFNENSIMKGSPEDGQPQPRFGTVSPYFYDLFVNATCGFSNDAIRDMINNAVYEAHADLAPEEQLGFSFKFNEINTNEKSYATTLMRAALFAGGFPILLMEHLNAKYSLIERHLYAQLCKKKQMNARLNDLDWKGNIHNKYSKNPLRVFRNEALETSWRAGLGILVGSLCGGYLWRETVKLYTKFQNPERNNEHPFPAR